MAALTLGDPQFGAEALYWLESRPAEGGRSVIVRREHDGRLQDVTAAPFSVRSTVHEYGGGAWAALERGVVFVNFADQQIWLQGSDGAPRRLTEQLDCRYGDLVPCRTAGRLFAVREQHPTGPGPVSNVLVAINLESGREQVLDSGWDFYSSPAPSPDGRWLAWLCWRHPDMPWSACTLRCARIEPDGSLSEIRSIAGGPGESVFQPQWSPSGTLYFISDRSGYWNLYRWQRDRARPILPRRADFGVAQWIFGLSTYAFPDARSLICAWTRNGSWTQGRLALDSLRLAEQYGPASVIAGVRASAGGQVAMRVAAPDRAPSIILFAPGADVPRIVREAVDPVQYQDLVPLIRPPEPLSFPTTGGERAHGLYYRPARADCQAPRGTRPPLIVRSHGGPTSAASSALDLAVQFFVSRGFAFLDLNYRGSTGYGRAYRERLKGQWGILDVEDCIAAALHLASRNAVNPRALIATGSSAGGFTSLCALTFHDTFACGSIRYGPADLATLAADTHKFEAHYLDWLVAPWPAGRDIYQARSPGQFTERLRAPVLLLHGQDDRVVPLAQANALYASIKNRDPLNRLQVFEGEQHGFRRPQTLIDVLESELAFYQALISRHSA